MAEKCLNLKPKTFIFNAFQTFLNPTCRPPPGTVKLFQKPFTVAEDQTHLRHQKLQYFFKKNQ